METHHILAVIQSDLQLICNLRTELDAAGYVSVNITRSSEEAILYLRGVGIYSDRHRYPLPSVLILDSENPDGSDLDVLSWVREHELFRCLPVLLLSPEHHNAPQLSCALDNACYLVDRSNRRDLLNAIFNLEAAELQSALALS